MDALIQADTSLFYLVNSHHHYLTDWILYIVSLIGEYAIIWWIIGLIALFWDHKSGKKVLFLLVIGILLTVIIDDLIIKQFIFRTRPYLALPDVQQVGVAWANSSFPSGHASATLVSLIVLGKYYHRLIIPLIIFTLLTLYSRPYLGMHYPLDVLAGTLVGVFAGWAVLYSDRFFKSASTSKNPRSSQ